MTESKIELTERLRREGRWAEASKFKDTALQEFRAKGMKKAEAAEEAWNAMAKAYPPLAAVEESVAEVPDTAAGNPHGRDGHDEELIDVDALLERVGDRQPPDLVRDILWTYENLPNRKAKPEDAPSLGAWSLLQWARQYRNRFFEMVLPKAMAARPNEEEEQVKQERKRIDEIQAVLEQIQQGMDEELRADVPGVLQQRVRDMLSNWVQQCGVSIAADARAHLDSAIVRLIRDCMRAVAPSSGGE